jgi:hypothetical protein
LSFSILPRSRFAFRRFSVHCTLRLTVAVLLAIFGSDVSAMEAPFSVITVPDGAVTCTVRTIHVVFGLLCDSYRSFWNQRTDWCIGIIAYPHRPPYPSPSSGSRGLSDRLSWPPDA